jgi:thioredoxin 1
MSFTTPIHTNEQSIDRVLQAGLPVLLVFWRSRDCAPCEQLNPVLDRLAASFAGKALIAKVEAGDNRDLVRRYDVTQLPELILVRDGRMVARATGAVAEAGLQNWLGSLLKGASLAAPSGPSMPLSVAGWAQGASNAPGRGSRPAGAPPPRSTPPEPRTSGGTAHPVVLTDQTFEKVVSQSDKPVLVDFWAPWCGPCRMVAPAVEQLAVEFAGRAVVAKLNVDENPWVSQRFDIRSIPALFVFQRGQVVERIVGAQPASALRAALERHCRAS